MTNIELALRLVACPHWLPGMRTLYGDGPDSIVVDVSELDIDGLRPDLGDAGTRGHVLALIREAWGCADICPLRIDDEWTVRSGFDGFDYGDGGNTEAEALVAALEAAPAR